MVLNEMMKSQFSLLLSSSHLCNYVVEIEAQLAFLHVRKVGQKVTLGVLPIVSMECGMKNKCVSEK